MLAHFAEAIRPAARAVTDDALDRLQKLLARRRQLVVMRNAEKQRLGKATDPITRRSLKAMITSLDKQLGVIDARLLTMLNAMLRDRRAWAPVEARPSSPSRRPRPRCAPRWGRQPPQARQRPPRRGTWPTL